MKSATSWGRVIKAGLVKNWRLTVTYPSMVVNRIVGPIVAIAIAFYSYTALVPQGSIQSAFARVGENVQFTGYLILSQTVFSFFSNLNFRGGMAIQRERWMGTLEAILLAPTSRAAFILGESLYGLIDSGWTTLLGLLVTSVAFGAAFHLADPLLALLAVILTLTSLVALSVFFAAFYVLTRSAGPVAGAIVAPTQFLSGTRFPVAALPIALQAVSYALPVTYGMIVIRAAFLGGATLASMIPTLGILLAFSVVSWIAGILLIGRMERLAKQRGTLHRY
ncbi:MAG: ABC transporter permease [Thermoplasmatota archaeon]